MCTWFQPPDSTDFWVSAVSILGPVCCQLIAPEKGRFAIRPRLKPSAKLVLLDSNPKKEQRQGWKKERELKPRN